MFPLNHNLAYGSASHPLPTSGPNHSKYCWKSVCAPERLLLISRIILFTSLALLLGSSRYPYVIGSKINALGPEREKSTGIKGVFPFCVCMCAPGFVLFPLLGMCFLFSFLGKILLYFKSSTQISNMNPSFYSLKLSFSIYLI